MTKKGDPNPIVMLLNHGLMKIRLVSASGLLFSALGRHTFHPRPCLPAGRHRKGFPGGTLINAV